MEQKKILLIEDNLDVRENTAEILELAGYQVITAENGKIGVAKAQAELPDLIICDVMMPVLDGYGVLHILSKQSRTAAIPFIYLTAKAEKVDFRKGMNMGADDYLTKPFEELDLLETIERRLKKAELLQRDHQSKEEGLTQLISIAKADFALHDLNEEHEKMTFDTKQHVFREDAHPKYLYFIHSGSVKTFRTNQYGKELITAIHTAGQYVGYHALFDERPYQESALALEETCLSLIPKDDFFKLVFADRNVALSFIKLLANNVEQQQDRLIEMAYASVRHRLLKGLYDLGQQAAAGKDRVSIEISREDLANMIGTSKETLIRTLSNLKAGDLVSTKGRYTTIKSLKELEKLLEY